MRNILLLVLAASVLSSCGTTSKDRALSGAGIGAGVGMVGGAIAGANPVTAAAIGAAVGATTGAAVDKSKLDLGKPIWK